MLTLCQFFSRRPFQLFSFILFLAMKKNLSFFVQAEKPKEDRGKKEDRRALFTLFSLALWVLSLFLSLEPLVKG